MALLCISQPLLVWRRGWEFEVARVRAPARGPCPLASPLRSGHPMKGAHPLPNPRFASHPLLQQLVEAMAPLCISQPLLVWRRGWDSKSRGGSHPAPARGPGPLAPPLRSGHPMKGAHPLHNPRSNPTLFLSHWMRWWFHSVWHGSSCYGGEGVLQTIREAPINRSVSPIMSCVFPSLFPQT